MRRCLRYAAAALLMLVPALARAHSLDDIQQLLMEREPYFEAVDLEAPDFALRDAEGRGARLGDYRGKVVILNFVCASGREGCRGHANRMPELQATINQTPMKEQVQFVTVTTDPKNDTPEVMRKYGSTRNLDPLNWTFLTTTPDHPEDMTRRLAESYGVKFVPAEDSRRPHAAVIHVIGQDGRLRARFHGPDFQAIHVVFFVNALLNEAQEPHAHGGASAPDLPEYKGPYLQK